MENRVGASESKKNLFHIYMPVCLYAWAYGIGNLN